MNLLITGALPKDEELFNKLESYNYKIYYQQFEKDKLVVDPVLIEAIICNGFFLYHDIKKFTNLKMIQLTSVGYDRVPLDIIRNRGIKLFNANGVYSIPMAEFAILGILQLYKTSFSLFNKQKQHIWEKNRNLLELSNKKAGILGMGSVGIEIAKRLKSFGSHIIGFDIKDIECKYFDNIENIINLSMYLKDIDILICCLPLTNDTLHLIDDNKIKMLSEHSIIINISRGGVIDESALYNALFNKEIMGAYIDVFENEPLLNISKFWELDNIIITPHNSFISNQNNERLKKLVIKNFYNVLGDR